MLFVVIVFSLPGLSAAEYYVSPTGSDKNPGTKEKPFATLERARDAVRKLKKDEPRCIVMRGGDYYDVSLLLEPQDSGLAIKAAAGEKPVLYGGKPVAGWKKDGDKFYAADISGVKEGTRDFRSLVVDGRLRSRARLPEKGEFTHLTRFDAKVRPTSQGGFRGADKPELKRRLKYKKGDLGPWLDVNNAELDIMHSWDSSMVGLKSHDPETQMLHFSNPAGYPPGAFGVRRYVVWNIRQGMHKPGQWYLDRTRGKVVYWPNPGENIAKLNVVAPTTQTVIRITGTLSESVSGISLQGLDIRCTTTLLTAGKWAAGVYKGAIEARFVRKCLFRDLHISAVGGQGIRITRSTRNVVTNCTIEMTGAGGIYAVQGSHSRIVGNRVQQIGQTFSSAIAIRTADSWKAPKLSHHNQIAYNLIKDTPYIGIECKGVSNRYENNMVSNAMCVLNDGAAFYSNGKKHIIRGNVVRDIAKGKSAHAYYIDELGEDILVESNAALNCSWPVHVHLAHNNTYRNNLFIAEKDCKLTFPRSRNIIMEKNVIHAGGTISGSNTGAVSKWKDNVFFSRAGQYHGIPGNAARRVDPLLKDAADGDYGFKPESPALKLGIKPVKIPGIADFIRAVKTRNNQ